MLPRPLKNELFARAARTLARGRDEMSALADTRARARLHHELLASWRTARHICHELDRLERDVDGPGLELRQEIARAHRLEEDLREAARQLWR